MPETLESVLVLGMGNELMGDEGFGVHVVRLLLQERASLPGHVEVMEAGTSLLDLVPEMQWHARVILVDVIRAGQQPGTLYRWEVAGGSLSGLGAAAPISLHQWGVIETLHAADVLGMLPRQLTLLGAEPARMESGTELSPQLAQAAKKVTAALIQKLRQQSQEPDQDARRSA